MAAIQWNRPTALTVNYISNGPSILTLSPGINLGVNDSVIADFLAHPVVIDYLESGAIEVLKSSPDAKHDISGLKVIDVKGSDQPMPVTEVSASVKVKKDQSVADKLAALKESEGN